MHTENHRAFEGIRILDLSRVLAGPFCSTILADLGAEVIKIETPWGDDSRTVGPYFEGESTYFRLFNRNKYGITLNLKDEKDKEQFFQLVKRSDVLVENFRPGVMKKLGIDANALLDINPQLIVTSISGFGQEGSMSEAPAYDIVAQALSGLMSVTGHSPSQPTRVGISVGDLIPGLYAAIATLAAIQERTRSGKGQHIDIAMYNSLTSILESVGMRAIHDKDEPVAMGNDHAMTVPFSTYQAKDGQVVIAALNEKLVEKACEALEIPELLQDPKFSSNESRRENREEFRERIEEVLTKVTVEDAIERLREFGVPTSPVSTVKEALTGDIGSERQVIAQEADGFKTLASPIRIRGSVAPSPAPLLGEHNLLIQDWLKSEEDGCPPIHVFEKRPS